MEHWRIHWLHWFEYWIKQNGDTSTMAQLCGIWQNWVIGTDYQENMIFSIMYVETTELPVGSAWLGPWSWNLRWSKKGRMTNECITHILIQKFSSDTLPRQSYANFMISSFIRETGVNYRKLQFWCIVQNENKIVSCWIPSKVLHRGPDWSKKHNIEGTHPP